MKSVSIVGAGLAGCEAALQLATHGFKVKLYDSKPERKLETYQLSSYAELVCNNSIGNLNVNTPLGLLLQELQSLGSRLITIAKKCRIDDPVFFAIDKIAFSQAVTKELQSCEITLINKHLSEIPKDDYVVIATGPLTDEYLIENLSNEYSIEGYHFFDASSPVVDIRTVNLRNNNIRKITNDLYAISIPMHDFRIFSDELVRKSAGIVVNPVDNALNFEKCQSIERIAMAGMDELYSKRFKQNYFDTPCLLLRRENAVRDGFLLVGCMTTLCRSAQLDVFSLIPGLEKCKIIKYGRMHRNTFLNVPQILNEFFQIKGTNTYIIGQLSGIDGYAPAIASGWVAAMRIIHGDSMPQLPQSTMIGGLSHYVSNIDVTDFQPMCASFALLKYTDNFLLSSKVGVESITKAILKKPYAMKKEIYTPNKVD